MMSERRWLEQERAVEEIETRFGTEHIYENENGTPAISRAVLKAFRKLTPDVVWEPGAREWRLRDDRDEPGKRRVD